MPAMQLILFLIQVFVITLSGALFPGPVSATAVAMGTRNRWAGLLIGCGHAVLEVPVLLLIIFGGQNLLTRQWTQITVGLAGGMVLLYIATQMAGQLRRGEVFSEGKTLHDRPVLAGIILSASNPYFLIWWVTIGLALATTARGFGIWAFVLFAIVHWLCDCGWLQALSWASCKGAKLAGGRVWKTVLFCCCAVMFFFGAKFIYGAVTAMFFRLTAVN